jgi:hypothetical protein
MGKRGPQARSDGQHPRIGREARAEVSSAQRTFPPSRKSVTCGIQTTPPTLGETSAPGRRHPCIGITKRTQFRDGAHSARAPTYATQMEAAQTLPGQQRAKGHGAARFG